MAGNVGRRVQALRAKAGRTQEELAAAVSGYVPLGQHSAGTMGEMMRSSSNSMMH